MILRFGSEIASELHVIAGQTARREAARLRKEIDALERFAKSSVPVRIDGATPRPSLNSSTKSGSQRIRPSQLPSASFVSRVVAKDGLVEIWRETEARFSVAINGDTVSTSVTHFSAKIKALAWCRGKRVPIAAE